MGWVGSRHIPNSQVLPAIDAEVPSDDPLRSGDCAERFLEAASHESSEARGIHEVVGLTIRSDFLCLVLQPDLP